MLNGDSFRLGKWKVLETGRVSELHGTELCVSKRLSWWAYKECVTAGEEAAETKATDAGAEPESRGVPANSGGHCQVGTEPRSGAMLNFTSADPQEAGTVHSSGAKWCERPFPAQAGPLGSRAFPPWDAEMPSVDTVHRDGLRPAEGRRLAPGHTAC